VLLTTYLSLGSLPSIATRCAQRIISDNNVLPYNTPSESNVVVLRLRYGPFVSYVLYKLRSEPPRGCSLKQIKEQIGRR
jgi:hypothetical protein